MKYTKKTFIPLLALLLFLAIGVILWLTSGHIFFLINFGYIGIFLCLGVFLFLRGKLYGRLITQLGVGLYMFGFLGILMRENMQIEGFWYFLFLGVFQAAVIHYTVAKILGPLIFGRSWCGWACWTAAVLDFLPYKIPEKQRMAKLGVLRFITFAFSLIFVSVLFIAEIKNLEHVMWLGFLIGNGIYYLLGIVLAFAFKDNRAFCKYLCPITVFLKPMSYFSLLRVKPKEDKCIKCGICEKSCPMNVEVSNPARSRKNATECILCLTCTRVCPQKAL